MALASRGMFIFSQIIHYSTSPRQYSFSWMKSTCICYFIIQEDLFNFLKNLCSLLYYVRGNTVSILISLFLFTVAKYVGHDTSFKSLSLKNDVIKNLITFHFQEHFWFRSLHTNSKDNLYAALQNILYHISICISSRRMSPYFVFQHSLYIMLHEILGGVFFTKAA